MLEKWKLYYDSEELSNATEYFCFRSRVRVTEKLLACKEVFENSFLMKIYSKMCLGLLYCVLLKC